VAAVTAFFIAALVNYFLSIKLIFRHNAKWRTSSELLVYFFVVSVIGIIDMYTTVGFVSLGSPPWLAKVGATAIGLVLNFAARRFIVFPEAPRPDWKPQDPK
jgi:putative flippase GtrA